MGAMCNLQVIDNGVFVCTCKVCSDIIKIFHNMNFYMTVILHNYRTVNIVVQLLIIDIMHPVLYWKKSIEKI